MEDHKKTFFEDLKELKEQISFSVSKERNSINFFLTMEEREFFKEEEKMNMLELMLEDFFEDFYVAFFGENDINVSHANPVFYIKICF